MVLWPTAHWLGEEDIYTCSTCGLMALADGDMRGTVPILSIYVYSSIIIIYYYPLSIYYTYVLVLWPRSGGAVAGWGRGTYIYL